MNRMVESGKTLLVDGPASVIVISGKVEVFGSAPDNLSRIVIRQGKRLPFTVEKTANFEISLGANATIEEVDGTTIPESWMKSLKELLSFRTRPVIGVVLGTVDSGKTSFCTYLVNRLADKERKVAILDGDLGQSDIGPPCTIAYNFAAKPVTDLFNLEAKNAFFVGATSPSEAIDKTVEGLTTLMREILESAPDFVVVNTDGWVVGEDAVKYKSRLIGEVKPDIVFCIQRKGELAPLLDVLEKFRVTVVDSPVTIRQRSREKRKNLRELGYVKYLRNAKVQSLPIDWLKIKQNGLLKLGRERRSIQQAEEASEISGIGSLHHEKNRVIGTDDINKVEEVANKKAVLFRKGQEGLLLGLYDSQQKFLGIGVLREIDYSRSTLKVLTPIAQGISTAIFGKVKLDKNLREIPTPIEGNSLEFKKT